ncbi:MAG: enoyl-CoA hydratase/isomerase family protein [Gammaproteobacteria bacterium]|nr:enoyl-CoA hydratase/isomerase family protein [Gammaproteobacteria bacterium]
MSEVVQISQNQRVRTIRLNRPEKKNALSDELAWGIVDAVAEAARDDSVWVIALTGTGDAFCAGLDLTGERDPTAAPLSAQDRQLDDIGWVGRFLLTLRESCDKPIVAGINGVAVGAGLSLAMAADIRLISRRARLMAGYTRIGGSPDGGLSFSLTQAIGYEQSMRFMLENRTVLGDEAVRLGMAGELVEDGELADRLEAYCQSLSAWSPITTRLTKRAISRAASAVDLETHVRYELSNIRRAFDSEDAKEARRAFLEKRAPVMRGK